MIAVVDCSLKAPFDAVVLKRMVELGTLVGPGSPGFVLADTSSVKVTFGVPDHQLRSVKIGTRFDVSLDALGPLSTNGVVSSIAHYADPKTRLFEVEIVIPNPEGRIRVGMIATLVAPEALPKLVLAVPLRAVVRPPGKSEGYALFVAEGDTLRARQVELSGPCGQGVEVMSGLGEGDRFVVEGAAQAFDGERVTLVP